MWALTSRSVLRLSRSNALPLTGVILDSVQHLADAVIRHVLQNPDLRLLTGAQQRVHVIEEFLLIGLKLAVCSIEFTDQPLQFLLRTGAAIDGLAQLVQSPSPALTDFESVVQELVDEGQDFRENLRLYFGVLLKLFDVKRKNCVFDQ